MQTLIFLLQNFLRLDIVSGVKSVKLSNVATLVPRGIRRTGSKFLKEKDQLLKEHSFETSPWTFSWKSETPLDLHQTWCNCARLQEKTFELLKSEKKSDSKITKIHTFRNSTSNQLKGGGLKVFNDVLVHTSGSKSRKMSRNVLFVLLWPGWA